MSPDCDLLRWSSLEGIILRVGAIRVDAGLLDGYNRSLSVTYPYVYKDWGTKQYHQFAVNYYLYREGMKWFWHQYTTSMEERNQILDSPNVI